MAPFLYRAYGLTFSMPFACPELRPAPDAPPHAPDRPPDVVVRFGDTPDYLATPMAAGTWYQVEPNRFLCRPRGVADFLVENGTCITIKPLPGTPENDLRAFLLGICISVLLPQRGILCLHASAVRTRQGAVLFAGDPGAGKSSTLAEFLRRGYAMLSDDMCGVVQNSVQDNAQDAVQKTVQDTAPDTAPGQVGRVCVLPAFPQIKMWRAAAERLGIAYDKSRRVTVHEDKYGIGVQQFADEAIPFAALYWLGLHDDDHDEAHDEAHDDDEARDEKRVELTPLSGMEKFGAFAHNASGWRTLNDMDVLAPALEIASAAANQVRVCRLLRPARRDTLAELVDLVVHDLEAHCTA